jgi:glutaredoxin 3
MPRLWCARAAPILSRMSPSSFLPARTIPFRPAVPTDRRARLSNVLIYSTAVCPYCVAAKNFLKNKGVSYTEVRIDTDPQQRQEMMQRARRTSVPQIFVGDTHVGGYDDLVALDRAGGLQPLLAGTP